MANSSHSLASAVNRLVIAKGIVKAEDRQASYYRLRTLVRTHDAQTVEDLWLIVQISMRDRAAARAAAAKSAAAPKPNLLDRLEAAMACEQHQDCQCPTCVEGYHAYLSEMAHEQYERDNA